MTDTRRHDRIPLLLARRGSCAYVMPGFRRAVCVVLLSGPLVCMFGCQMARSQRTKDVRAVQPTRTGGYVEFVTRQRNREQDSRVGSGKKKFRESIYEENLKLEMDGFVYHPNFLEFSVGGLIGLLQHEYEDVFAGRKRKSGRDGTVSEFNLEAHFLRKKKYPGSVFARRYRALEPRPFNPSIETTSTNYGVLWQYVSEKTPTRLQFNYNNVRLDPLSDSEPTGLQKNTFLRFETAYRFSDLNTLSLTLDHRSVTEEPFALNYDSNELKLTHKLRFGDSQVHHLESELNFFDQRGTYDIRRIRLREVLRLQHTPTLQSWYLFEAIDRDQSSLSGVPPIGERSYSLSAVLEHKLYDSLVSEFIVFGQTQEFDSGLEIDRYGGQASFDYRKTNPWGVFLANYRVRYQRENRAGGTQAGAVLDERHTFQDPDPVILANSNVVRGSILMTADDGLTIYRVGADYTLRIVGDRTEIERVPTGRILDGQVIYVDYTFDIGGTFELDTLTHHLTVRQDFDFGLSPYYRLRRQDQTITPADATGIIPEDITAQIFGVEFDRRSFRTRAEFEDHESTISPFRAVRWDASIRRRFRSGATGILKTRWSRVEHDPPNQREVRFFTVEARYRHPITARMTVEGSVLYRDESDSLSGDDRGVDVDLALEWSLRETEIRVMYELGRYRDVFADNESSVLYIQVRRRF